jgi:hypothetical protein
MAVQDVLLSSGSAIIWQSGILGELYRIYGLILQWFRKGSLGVAHNLLAIY